MNTMELSTIVFGAKCLFFLCTSVVIVYFFLFRVLVPSISWMYNRIISDIERAIK